MSWIPPSAAGIYEPSSRTAPRPAASAPAFTFGRLQEKQAAAAAPPPSGGISQRPDKANFDPSAEQLRWWWQPRNEVTVSGSSNKDIEAFWQAADGKVVSELVNTGARHANKAQGLGSTIKASLVQDTEQFSLAGAQSLYKSDLTAGHVRVGKRGVCLPPEAMQAYEESRKQAEHNKQIGRSTNMKLGLF